MSSPEQPNLNDNLPPEIRRQIDESIRTGYDDIPLVIDHNGDLVQPDRPMPSDEFDDKRREAEGS
jgi:hypothetical protein